jgi:signal recognition particle subunit SRP54
MVLAELGKKISSALAKLNKVSTVDEKLVDSCMQEISMALLQADVNVKFQKTVVEGLTKLLESERKPFQPKKGIVDLS